MNTKERTLQWTTIETAGDDTGDENLRINLSDDTTEEETPTNGKQESQDTRRPLFSVSKNQENKDEETRTEIEEDKEERTVPNRQTRELAEDEEPKKEKRAHKRIQTLLAERNARDTEIKSLREELSRVKSKNRQVEKTSAVSQRDLYKQQLDEAESQLEQALAGNDAAKVAKLTKQIAENTLKYNAYNAVSEDLDNEPEEEEETTPQSQRVEVPEEARSWIKRNPWFMQDQKKHVLARMISQEISNEGELDPNDQEYWQELDKRLESFGIKQATTTEKQTKPTKRSPVVSSRTDEDSETLTADVNQQFKRQGNRVIANPTREDEEMAERMGVPVVELMKEKYKYAQQGFKGYVNIDIPGQS